MEILIVKPFDPGYYILVFFFLVSYRPLLYNQVAPLLLAVLVLGWVVGLEPLAADCIGQNYLALIWWGLGIPTPLRYYDLDPTG